MNAQGTERTEKRLCVGLLAHVDAGKTTLSEAMLYRGGRDPYVLAASITAIHFSTPTRRNASRGITIFSKQADPPAARLHADAA